MTFITEIINHPYISQINIQTIIFASLFSYILGKAPYLFIFPYNLIKNIIVARSFEGKWHTYRYSRRDNKEDQIHNTWHVRRLFTRTGYYVRAYDDEQRLDYAGTITGTDDECWHFSFYSKRRDETTTFIMRGPDADATQFLAISISRNYDKQPHATAYFGCRDELSLDDGISRLSYAPVENQSRTMITSH